MTGLDRLHEIAEDVGRTVWLGDLSAALHDTLDAIAREARDPSGYESDVLAWVEKNGGLDAVKEQRRESIPRAAYERKKAGWLEHIEECETALGRRNERIAELGCRVNDLMIENAELRKRAMPEGIEWPTVDGCKVDFKTPYQPSLGVLEAVSIYSNGACEVMSHDGIIKPVSEIHVAKTQGTFPNKLTHEAPDSWGSVWMDVSNGGETPEGMMRRCRALARRGE